MNVLRLASLPPLTTRCSRRPRPGAWRLLLPLAFGLQLACSGRGGPEEQDRPTPPIGEREGWS